MQRNEKKKLDFQESFSRSLKSTSINYICHRREVERSYRDDNENWFLNIVHKM